jgi:UDP-N-acetylmuramate dehydrogenase
VAVAEAGEDIELAPLTTLKLGGPAERLVKVTETGELIRLVQAADSESEPLFFLAGGSNVVIADQGVPGTTIWIQTSGIEERELEDGRVSLTVAAGESWDELVARAVDAGLSGIECLSGIPGSVGATPIQNVGAYGQEVSSTIASVLALDRESGELTALTNEDCGFGYRSSRFKGGSRFLVLAVEFVLSPSEMSAPVAYAQLAAALEVEPGERVPLTVARETVLELRRSKSMVVDPADPDSVSAGSFFTNPLLDLADMADLTARAEELLGPDDLPPTYPAPEGLAKTSAAWLIERSGFTRGFGDGPIGLSRNHTLAIVNRGGGTTTELVAFAHGIAERVEEIFGVALVPEPVFVNHRW